MIDNNDYDDNGNGDRDIVYNIEIPDKLEKCSYINWGNLLVLGTFLEKLRSFGQVFLCKHKQ